MNFFKKFPSTDYLFSNDSNQKSKITDIFRYVSAEDKNIDGIVNYTYYTVPDGMRPDVLSSHLYGAPDYHWSFFIINTALKQNGINSWPKGSAELENYIFEKYMKYAVVEMNSTPQTFSYTTINNNAPDEVKTNIFSKTVKGISLDSDIKIVSPDKKYKCSFVSYNDDRIILKKNTLSSFDFTPNEDIYWNLPVIKLISDVGFNGEVSFQYKDSRRGSPLSDEISILNYGENYFSAPEVIVDESPKRECLFSINLNNGVITVLYPGEGYCRVPKLKIIIPSIGYNSPLLKAFAIDSTSNYGLKSSYVLPQSVLDQINAYPTSYKTVLTNEDIPLVAPIAFISNASSIDDNLGTFILQNTNPDVVKRLKWNIDLFKWVLNNRIDMVVADKADSSSLSRFKLAIDLANYIYRILVAFDAEEEGDITSAVTEMVAYFTGTIYEFLTQHIQRVITVSNIDFNHPNAIPAWNYSDRLFYEGFNYNDKFEGSSFGINDGWLIPEYSYGRAGNLYKAPTFSLENLYVYNLPSGIGSIKFGEESIAIQNKSWNSEFDYVDLGEKWYSFKVKKIGNNPNGNFCIFSDLSNGLGNMRDGGVGIQLAGNTVYDVIQNENPSEAYIHDFGTGDTVTIVGRMDIHPFAYEIENTLWFNPDEGFESQAEIESSDVRRSINISSFYGGSFPFVQQLSGIGFLNNTGFIIDEVRIGKTFESVSQTPPLSIPELKTYLTEITDKTVVESTNKDLIFDTQGVYGEAQNATHHYEDLEGNELSYFTGANGVNTTRVTNYEYETYMNDERKQIKVVRPEYIKQFDSKYTTLIGS